MSEKSSTKMKLIRVIDKYNLEGLGDELVEQWTATGPHRKSCRELADFFNTRVLDAALREEGIIWDKSLVEDCAVIIADKDRSLTGFDIQNRGVDTDDVEDDMLTYQTVHNYLTNIRGIDLNKDPNGIRDRINNLQQMQSKMETVASNTASRSINRDQIDGPVPSIEITAEYICQACGGRTKVTQYLQNRGCPVCDDSSTEFC